MWRRAGTSRGRRRAQTAMPSGVSPLGLSRRPPAEPAREIPVPFPEHLHARRKQHAADDRRVDNHGRRQADTGLLELERRKRSEEREDENHDGGGGRDGAGGGGGRDSHSRV